MADKGKFITLEGPEGSGKTTQADFLVQSIESRGIEVIRTREPGGTPTGEMIRDILQHNRAGEDISDVAEVMLFAASRAQHVSAKILPALEKGIWVLCDRFIDSTTAYQGYGRQQDVEQMELINGIAIQGCLPDLTLLFDIPVEVSLERMGKRHKDLGVEADRIEKESCEFHKRVRDGYLALASRYSDRFVVVDAAPSVETIRDSVWSVVEERLMVKP